MSDLFTGRVALVTGGSNGIGRAAAILFARHGARVAVADVMRDDGEAVVEEIAAAGGEAIFVDGNIADREAVRAMVATTVERFGRLDCAFNNAGICPNEDAQWDEDAFRRTIDVNVTGTMYCIKEEIPHMLKAGKGTIVNTASISGLISSVAPSQLGYTSSKHAVIGLTKTAALRHARDNIRVNALCPGVTRTRMVAGVMEQSEEVRRTLENMSPMGRVADPAEMAECAIWLCSDKSSFVNGHALVADGGFVAQ